MAKVLDGNYDDRAGSPGPNHQSYRKQSKAEELDDFYKMAAEWSES